MKELLEELGFKDDNGVYLPMLSEFVKSCNDKWSYADNIKFHEVVKYVKFITQPLTKGMFIPCDEDGYTLKPCTCLPMESDFSFDGLPTNYCRTCNGSSKYKQAKEQVLFDGWSQRDSEHLNFMNFEFDLTVWGLYTEEGESAHKYRYVNTIEKAINNGVKLYLK